ncbi:serine/threonine-protein kinase [Saccharothrix carnea]|uniref:non-specific serine/threonine protein kinase n=1 Tax=Saccharothrix carnea TaxID=1280637 RepID=A0A2P8HAD4_SACCR|nr:serine/threonine-protein kinase [Saccharothrix carnea]PSL43174.1 serine/threonine-protein kinase [Saccharothrix carnea]
MAEAFGPYRVGELLGRGGMGEVHRAHDTAHDRVVALKRLSAVHNDDEEFRARFRRESRIAARLREPHVIPIHAYGEIDGRLYLDMRLVEGRDLAAVIEDGPLDPDRAVRIIAQVAGALDAAHADGLVHRDVKPSNILVTPDDFVYLVDFGIARSVLPAGTHLTASGAVIGTLDYLAPERFGDGQVDGRADVYALACVLHACVTGHRPFEVDSAAALLWAHLQQPPPAASATNPAVPRALDDVIRHGMAKDPTHRFPTAGALATAAAEALATPSLAVTPPVTTPPHPAAGSSGESPSSAAPSHPPAPPSAGGAPAAPPAGRALAGPQQPGRHQPGPRSAPHFVATLQSGSQGGAMNAPAPPARRTSGRRVAPIVAGAVALAIVAVVLVWSVDWAGDRRLANSATVTTTAATTTTATTTAESRTRTTTAQTTTATTVTVDQQVTVLLDRLPGVYRGNPSCAPTPSTGPGVTATVTCTKANQQHFRFPPPDQAVFHLFTDRAAQDAHFKALVDAKGIPREDESGGCRPLTRPAHYALYYRSESGPVPGEYTTCFVSDGVGQLWWVDTRTSTTGVLRSSTALDPDALDQLGYWWNTMILTPMP